jgi:hypothetical protein
MNQGDVGGWSTAIKRRTKPGPIFLSIARSAWALVVCLQLLVAARESAAQSGMVEWSQPINLSNTAESSGRPAIVADLSGLVHVFWSEEVGGDSILDIPAQLIHNGNTIFYTRWDGMSWTEPVDILFVPGDQIAEYVAVAVDKEDYLHIVWTGQSDFYYSTAAGWQAFSARAWSEPMVVAGDSARSAWESDIITDAVGNIHIVFATRGPTAGIYHIASFDRGRTWSAPVLISQPFDTLETSFSNVRVRVDGADRLHTVWQTNQKEGYGQGVYYARSLDGGQTWAQPVQMGRRDPGEYEVAFPYLAAVGESEIHMVYIDGEWHIGRWHRISRDGGETWSEPVHILTDLEGVNGYTILLTDGLDGLHLVTTMRTRTQISGPIFYAHWLGTEWSPVERPFVESDQTGPGAHWTAATIGRGNEIHVVWNTNFSHKAGEIWFSRGIIPGVSPDLVPPASARNGSLMGASPLPTIAAGTGDFTSTSSETANSQEVPLLPDSPDRPSEAVPVLVALASSVCLLLAAIAWTRIFPTRR